LRFHFNRPAEVFVLMEILLEAPVFIGFKASRALRHVLDSLSDVQKAYVSSDDSAFLQSFEIAGDLYIGKLVQEAVSTDRVDDIRRNILSILRKLGPVVPLPTAMRIFACRAEKEGTVPAVAIAAVSGDEMDSPSSDPETATDSDAYLLSRG
jgi:hypothetical protein